MIDALCELSSRDPLTGLANRRQFELALAREIDRVARAGEPALLLMLDIDHFKRVNDTHGHAAGDLVLQRGRPARWRECVRPMDTVARIGGEEFAIDAAQLPGRVRPRRWPSASARAWQRRSVDDRAAASRCTVTVSIGGAFAPQWVRSSAPLWMERADQQLYRAKAEGRNRACLEPAAVSHVSAEEKGLLFGTLDSFRT